jgi:Pvc16 N-terminal domain/IPT/TIG domain
MSDYRAIAGVSSTLKLLLRNYMDAPVDVTLAPPDIAVDGFPNKRVNLYLYLVSQSPFLSNQEIPGQGHPGDYGHPPLSLSLHYLVTAHGETDTGPDADLHAQQILGDVMRVFHDFAIITPGLGVLDASLLNEFERVKITLQPLSLEEVTKLWTAMPKSDFRLSVAYEVSIVQIESELPRRLALPVKTRRIHLATLRRPQVTRVYRTPAANEFPGDPRAAVTQSLTIDGLGFQAPKTWVTLGTLDPIRVSPQPDGTLQIAVPDAQYPADADHPLPRPIAPADILQPGPQVVQVLTQWPGERVEGGLDHGKVFADTSVQVSNPDTFTLVPAISSINPLNGPATTVLTVNGTRLFHSPLRSYVLVGDVALQVSGAMAVSDTQLQVPLDGVANAVPPLPSGVTYPVRVSVNNAQCIDEKSFLLS